MPNFKGTVLLENTVHFSSDFSSDGKAATIIFDNLQVELGGVKGDPLIATLVASFVIPIESDIALPVSQDIRGYVSIDSGARATLVVHLTGKTILIDLSEETCSEQEFKRSFDSTLLPGIDYRVTFFLLVERDSDDPDVSVHLVIDSLDLELGKSESEKK